MIALILGFALVNPLAYWIPAALARLLSTRTEPKVSIDTIGYTTSNFPNIYRDGGGGGKINGLDFIWFADGMYTSGGEPAGDESNLLKFTSNSIACSNCDGAGITSLTDFGDAQHGPNQFVPFYYQNGEDDSITGVWPNQGFATLCDGACAVAFPDVINRTAFRTGQEAGLYNTPVQITLSDGRPVASRPSQSLFVNGEPFFGTFATYVGNDGYLYLFAKITKTATGNGLKVARVTQESWSDRSQYQYWNGISWGSQMPAYDDGGASNVFSWSHESLDGQQYGPGSGDIFYSPLYGVYILLFQPDDTAIDQEAYMSFSSGNDFTSGWSTPKVIFKIPNRTGGFSYAFHAYPNYDPTRRVIPISWTEWISPYTYYIGMANVTFF
ncbi:hypothetical protein GQ53DRAFT_714945 [Thozetella sp. PMI_491]|nr:hypothetical protein GQ53DRAFT_714945 [Thozetella sp. PMI_491]